MKRKIENFFKKNNGTAFKSKEIAMRLNLIDPADYTQLKSILHKLYKEDFLLRKGKRFQINLFPDSSKLQGTLQNHPDGYGFVIPKKKKLGDIFISERNIGPSFDGDTVEVVLFAKSKGKNLEGQIINIIERKRKEILGTLHKTKSFYFIIPDDFYLQRDIYIDKANLNEAKEGDKVIVGNIEWDTSMLNPEGVVLEVLGKEGSADVEFTAIARRYNLRTNFPAKVLRETEAIKFNISKEEVKKRLDLRKDIIFTIDPEDAKDYDDALSIKVLENGNFNLGVHIADVSHFVPKGSALDNQARLRGNSVYLVGKVIPMLPEKISNGVCSLIPYEDRFTYSVIFEITQHGKIVKYDIVKSIINSKRRFTYEEVQEIIETGKGDFYKEVIQLNNFAKTLRQKRIAMGSIEFSKPEVVFELDEDGNAIAIIRKEIKESNMLVEEFMLLANKTIARHLFQKKKSNRKSFVYRVHDKPDQEKIEEFSRFVNSLGFTFNKDSFKDSKEIQRLISQVKDLEENAVINELAIRSMAKAVYSNNN
ncbi:MAG: RNB domain-containing ribonuclease, partial [Bacteroidetes bacterium]|nr:RNB domain-containing ribonuclease [Bacteroidota bacterium]